jgi:hypothetical protein
MAKSIIHMMMHSLSIYDRDRKGQRNLFNNRGFPVWIDLVSYNYYYLLILFIIYFIYYLF